MTKIEIKNRYNGEVIFAHECDDNTIAVTVQEAVKKNVSLRYADLSNAVLSYANLRYADLRNAVLSYANMRYAKNIPHVHMACPTDGAFIGWKKVKGYLIKLEIPSDAERSSATTNKCRCSKAMVLSITDIGSGESINKIDNDEHAHTEYVVSEVVYPDSWDENRFNECSHGIHFFIDKQDAIDY
jgi:hypothetical protein